MTAATLEMLSPVQQVRAGRFPRRFTQLIAGLVLYGITLAVLIRSGLGNAPWDVLHQGLAQHLHMPIGTVLIIVSLLVLLLWIPIREVPGLGTICNAFLIGLAGFTLISHFEDVTDRDAVIDLLGQAGTDDQFGRVLNDDRAGPGGPGVVLGPVVVLNAVRAVLRPCGAVRHGEDEGEGEDAGFGAKFHGASPIFADLFGSSMASRTRRSFGVARLVA